MTNRDRFRGCLIGGAAGDALGYEIEFNSEEKIFSRFGENGITEYVLHDGKAIFSDDTQMTLFTANGLLNAAANGGDRLDALRIAYIEWYRCMEAKPGNLITDADCFLTQIEELYAYRAPGVTCMNAIAQGADGTVSAPINNSKGCGGVMRVAPIGLLPDEFTARDAAMLAADACALTHGHELGWLSGAALAYIVHLLAHDEECSVMEAVLACMDELRDIFPDSIWVGKLTALLNQAAELSTSEMDDLEAIHELGAGWVAEEALAIAVYAALRYSEDFEAAMIASVNHQGDSDSTGAICGNILGAALGLRQIPEKFVKNLQLVDTIQTIADDLYEIKKAASNPRYHRER